MTITYKRFMELLRDQFESYMEPAPCYLYINKKTINFDVDHFMVEAIEADYEIEEYWLQADEDEREEIEGEVLSWIDIPTKEEIEETRGCDRYHAMKDGD